MNFYTNFTAEIEKTIVSMSHEHKCLFILLTCDKMLPNYISFSEEVNWGNPQILKNVITTFKQIALGTQFTKSELIKLNKSVEENIPDLDDFESGSFAFDASIVFSEAMLFLINKDTENIKNTIQGALDTVDMFIQLKDDLDPNDTELDDRIQKSEYLIREFNRQRLIINHLKNIPKITREVIDELRQINDSHGTVVDIKLLD